MLYYLLLIISTVVIASLTIILWKRTRDVSFVAGISLLYYWTLYGSWFIIYNKLNEGSLRRYQYLEYVLFPIRLDQYYVLTLLIYSLFMWVILGTLVLYVRRPKPARKTIVMVSHPKMIFMGGIALFLSFLIVRGDVLLALENNIPPYRLLSFSINSLYTLHQVLNRFAILSFALGASVFLSGSNPKLIGGVRKRWMIFAYAVVLLVSLFFHILVGFKKDIFYALLSGLLLYLANGRRRPNKVLIATFIVSSILFLGLVNVSRGFKPIELTSALRPTIIVDALIDILASNEAFAAHFSLYGVLYKNVPPTYGASIISLVASVVPRVFWLDRPADVYPYYAKAVSAAPGQGYTIHHATGWFINFGLLGVIIGGALFARVWSILYNGFCSSRQDRPLICRIFFLIAPWTFVAYTPSLIRAGLEAYKGVVLEAFIMPTVIFYLAAVVIKAQRK